MKPRSYIALSYKALVCKGVHILAYQYLNMDKCARVQGSGDEPGEGVDHSCSAG